MSKKISKIAEEILKKNKTEKEKKKENIIIKNIQNKSSAEQELAEYKAKEALKEIKKKKGRRK